MSSLFHLSQSLPSTLVKPSKPRCYAEGPTQEGKDIVLRCVSSEGTSPLQYTWEKTSDTKILPASAVWGNGPFHTSTLKQIENRFQVLYTGTLPDMFIVRSSP